MNRVAAYAISGAALLLCGCATAPSGPSVMSLPGTGKSFEQFRSDDNYCRQFSTEQIGGTSANGAANDSLAKSAVAGTAIGAAIGAAVGGGNGAAIGAGTGLFIGSVEGSAAADASAYGAQQHYDNAYVQCMYAQGHRVPVSGNLVTVRPRSANPPVYYPPPPPPPAPGNAR